jgi:hypothetical protein
MLLNKLTDIVQIVPEARQSVSRQRNLKELPHDFPGNCRVNILQFIPSHHEINKIKLRKVTVNFVMSVCQPLPKEQSLSHWTDFHEI